MNLAKLLSFVKYQAAGNHFILIDARALDPHFFDLATIQKYCDPCFGIGANGLILIQNKVGFDFEMLYFNPDGSPAFCGNGARCAVLFAQYLQIIQDKAHFFALDGAHFANIKGDQVQISMQDVAVVQAIESNLHYIDTGAPHVVVWLDDIQKLDVVTAGKKLRHDVRFSPAGVNVNFASIQNDIIFVRTFERGVENETLACGTGVTAVALAAFYLKKIPKNSVLLQTLGGKLQVDFVCSDEQKFSAISLTGIVQQVFSGSIKM